jgi:hypothetical protein
METVLTYGKDPLIEYQECIDLGNGRELKITLLIRNSEKEQAKEAINVLTTTLCQSEKTTTDNL